MCPEIVLFGREIPTYGLLGVTGVLLGLLFVILRSKRFGLSADDSVYIYTLGCVGALIGAKLLYLVISLDEIIANIDLLFADTELFIANYLSAGMVFYGGAIGGVLGALAASHYFGKRLRDFFPVLAPALCLAHAVGRVGCFCAGCCYGCETDSIFGVTYTVSQNAPNGVSLLPIQLFEAAIELVIFVVLILLSEKLTRKELLLPAYVLMYAPARFILEFWRGDEVRGILFELSTSQWISLAVFIAAIIWFAIKYKNRLDSF
ncbi:MAG: prolipoprotein diacylglyceryl transferase [Ruminococcus sp.]|nr:prolipoprotein diacylglyceryl transferase [Ruminococcus sp.]